MRTDPEEDYARGWVPFLDCKIFLDTRPLIPRVETEFWVEQALAEIKNASRGTMIYHSEKRIVILDLFSGSGAIGTAILKHLPDARVDFGEIDAGHFPTIRKNIRENGVNEVRARIIKTDVWSEILGVYDFIFANPPYLSEAHRERIQKSVLAHEPKQALFAEEDGFAFIRKTIEGAAQHLERKGALYLEHEPEQAEAILTLAASNGLSAGNRKDQFGLARYSVLSAKRWET